MRKRLIVGLSLAALIIALLLLDGYLAPEHSKEQPPPEHAFDLVAWLCNGAICTAVVLVLTVLATYELVGFARARGYRPFGTTAQFFAAVLVIGPYISFNLSPLTGGYDESWGLLWMAIALSCVFLLQAVRRGTENTMENLAITIFIIFYAGGLAGFMTKLRMEVGGSAGVAVLLFSCFLVKMTDTGAYFTGRLIGRHKMVPWLSPKKTWEGFAGGIVITIVCAVVIGYWLDDSGLVRLRERDAYPWALLLLGLLLGLFSAGGDLCASLLKRDAAVKDSGQALPGLGGVLDVVDSPLLAAPVAWVFWTRMFHVVVAQ
ncbi:MAG: phosphatidate cytidylyltransferase [Phycisphaerae bacterium]|nr:phosphatidate cytidylyltransferase [Phycisphaerae bacterium]